MAGYGSDDGLTTWLAANGYTLPDSAPAPAILRQRGSDYIDALYGTNRLDLPRFPGQPAGGIDQDRAWPRSGATINGVTLPPDVVPVRVQNAAYAAAWQEAQKPGSLSASASGASAVKSKKVAVIEVEYFAGSGDVVADATLRLSVVDGLLAPLLLPAQPDVTLGLFAIGGRC